VHDIKSIPKDGLQYSVFLPVDLSHRQKPCKNGASTVKIRAVLSWQTLPSTTDPKKIPKWGNRRETLIHVKPCSVQSEVMTPYINGLGYIAVCDIDQSTGMANLNQNPFGGLVAITGFIQNYPKFVMEGTEQPAKYKVYVRMYDPTKTDVENPWQPLSNSFLVRVDTQIGAGTLPIQEVVEQKIDSEGYYTYLEDLHGGGMPSATSLPYGTQNP
jgi:hypothetical protein